MSREECEPAPSLTSAIAMQVTRCLCWGSVSTKTTLRKLRCSKRSKLVIGNGDYIPLAVLIHSYARDVRRHVDSAQAYKNEREVGEAVRESGIPREELFISMFSCSDLGRSTCSVAHTPFRQATKCVNKTHGYDSTLKGVDESLARFGLGKGPPSVPFQV